MKGGYQVEEEGLKWNLHLFHLLEIIQFLDSISWVRCASGNVFRYLMSVLAGKLFKCQTLFER